MFKNLISARRGSSRLAERGAFVLGGGLLVLIAARRPSRLSLPLALGGGLLLVRGVAGLPTLYRSQGTQRLSRSPQEGYRVRESMTINRPRAEVYQAWQNFEDFPKFMMHLESVHNTRNELGRETSRFIAIVPGKQIVEWEAEIYVDRPDEEIAWRSLEGSEIETHGVIRFNDAPGGRGTEVHITTAYRLPPGVTSPAAARFFSQPLQTQIGEDLRHFKEWLETGEIPTTFGQTSGRIQQTEAEREELSWRKHIDVVQEASEESFPASDAPGWRSHP